MGLIGNQGQVSWVTCAIVAVRRTMIFGAPWPEQGGIVAAVKFLSWSEHTFRLSLKCL